MQSMRYSPPPFPIPRGPSVECFTLLGMDRHSIKNDTSKHDGPCTNRQEWSFTGMNGMRSMRPRAWYAKYALIGTSMNWYALHKYVAS